MKYTVLAFSPICCLIPTIVNAQTIIPNQDNTGTIVNQQGNQFNIQGGSRSRDNTNLFHSFQEFNLRQGQIANFISTPNIENILGRINGGNPSIIHGLIQLTGGNSNLFLMNPAGIIFGAGASLNLPASFHVNTATGIGFNHNQWFQSIGNNDYQNLVGTPNKFIFSHTQPGTIINQGNLFLTTGKSLSFLGGSVINTGELSAPAGNITMVAVPGENIVKISQAGHLLNLEFLPLGKSQLINTQLPAISAVSLPELLTGNDPNNQANTIKINEFGQVVLGNTGFAINDINQTAINTGKIDVSQSNSGHGGQVNIIGKKVGLINSEINASGYNQGGTVLIGGDWQGQGIIPNAMQTYVDQNSLINADAIHNGNGGKVIIWSDDQTTFQGSITARGGIQSGDGGLVEISGKKQLIFDGKVDVTAVHGLPGNVLFDPDNLTLETSDSQDNLLTNSEGDINNDTDSQSSETVSQSEVINETKSDQGENTDNSNVINETDIQTNEHLVIDPFAPDESNNVTVNSENVNKLDINNLDVSGNIELQADNDLTVNQAIATDKSLKLVAGRSININADIDTSKGNGDIGIFANNPEVDPTKRQMGPANILQAENTVLNAGAGDITVEMGSLGEMGEIKLGDLTTKGLIAIQGAGANIYQVSANSLFRADKIILETSDSGGIGKSDLPLRINVHNLEATTGSGGIVLRAIAPLTIGDVSDDLTGITTYDGGEINLKVDGDLTATESISSYLDGEAENTQIIGDISITATGNIKTSDVNILTGNRDVGNIKIESTQGSIDATSGIYIFLDKGNVGNLSILANNDITTGDIYLITDNGNTGSINIETTQGFIDTTLGSVNLYSYKGNVGNLSILANNDIKTGEIYFGTDDGNIGNAIIESKQGSIDTSLGTIEIKSNNGNIGNLSSIEDNHIQILANDNIQTGNINIEATSGDVGNIKIESTQGSIDTSLGNIYIYSSDSIGNISIIALNDLIIGSTSISSDNGNIGTINIQSKQGSIDTQPLVAITPVPTPPPTPTPEPTPEPVPDEYISNDQNTDDLNDGSAEGVIDYYGNINVFSKTGNIGDFSMLAKNDIKTGDIVIRSIEGNIGNIKIESKQGVIDIASGFIMINAKNAEDVDININVTDEYKDHISISIDHPTPIPDTPTPEPTPNETPITGVAESKKNATDDNLNTIDYVLNVEGDTNPDASLYVGNQQSVNEKNNNSDVRPINNGVTTDVKSNVTVVRINNPENTIDIPSEMPTPSTVELINKTENNLTTSPIINNIEVTNGATDHNTINVDSNIPPVLTPITNIPQPQPNIAGNIQPVINNVATATNIDRGTINQNPLSASRGAINTVPNNSNMQIQPPVLSPVFNIPQQTNLNPITIPQSPINPIPQVSNNLPPNQNIKINYPSPVTINPNTITDPSNINNSIPRSENPNIVLTPTNLSQLNNPENNLLDDQLGQSSQTINKPVKIGSNSQLLEEKNIQIILNNLEQETGTKATFIAINSYLDSLQLVLYTANSQPVFKTIPVSRQQLLQLADNFRNINQLSQNISTNYLTEAQRLYQLLIQPIEDILQTNQTNTLLFSLDAGLGNFPIADLYDGEKFLAQKYRIIPYAIR